jgi:hypothetical protein
MHFLFPNHLYVPSQKCRFSTLNRPLVLDMKTVIGGGTINLDILKLKSSSNKILKKMEEISVLNFLMLLFRRRLTS